MYVCLNIRKWWITFIAILYASLKTKEKYHRSVGKISENLIVSYNQRKTQKAGMPKKTHCLVCLNLDYLLPKKLTV